MKNHGRIEKSGGKGGAIKSPLKIIAILICAIFLFQQEAFALHYTRDKSLDKFFKSDADQAAIYVIGTVASIVVPVGIFELGSTIATQAATQTATQIATQEGIDAAINAGAQTGAAMSAYTPAQLEAFNFAYQGTMATALPAQMSIAAGKIAQLGTSISQAVAVGGGINMGSQFAVAAGANPKTTAIVGGLAGGLITGGMNLASAPASASTFWTMAVPTMTWTASSAASAYAGDKYPGLGILAGFATGLVTNVGMQSLASMSGQYFDATGKPVATKAEAWQTVQGRPMVDAKYPVIEAFRAVGPGQLANLLVNAAIVQGIAGSSKDPNRLLLANAAGSFAGTIVGGAINNSSIGGDWSGVKNAAGNPVNPWADDKYSLGSSIVYAAVNAGIDYGMGQLSIKAGGLNPMVPNLATGAAKFLVTGLVTSALDKATLSPGDLTSKVSILDKNVEILSRAAKQEGEGVTLPSAGRPVLDTSFSEVLKANYKSGMYDAYTSVLPIAMNTSAKDTNATYNAINYMQNITRRFATGNYYSFNYVNNFAGGLSNAAENRLAGLLNPAIAGALKLKVFEDGYQRDGLGTSRQPGGSQTEGFKLTNPTLENRNTVFPGK